MKTLSFSDEVKGIMLRPYHIAKDCGCKFYLGSDAHKPAEISRAMTNFKAIVDALDLTEDDKHPFIAR